MVKQRPKKYNSFRNKKKDSSNLSKFLMDRPNKKKKKDNKVSKYAFSLKHFEHKKKLLKQKENKMYGKVKSQKLKSIQGKPMNYEALKAKRQNMKNQIYYVPQARSKTSFLV